MSSIFIQIDENPNCPAMDGQVFQPRTPGQVVREIRMQRGDEAHWCAVTGIDGGWRECDALAYLVDDSGDGACYLVVGGAWGLRFRAAKDATEWGEPYLLMAADGGDLRFSA
ncbi:conserved hypothetical protein [Candidatus Sulfopaludibacter sp. SbA3]|nr:conserved hypothetical protein [Candidatus Sulfopaludibacter sp. SbA3]